jgi:predicted Zn-dependent peptidase
MQKSLLNTENVFFYLTGCVSDANIQYLQNRMSDYDIPASDLLRKNIAPVPKHFGKREKSLHVKKSSTSELCFAFDFDTTRHTEAERGLLYDLLFSGENSRVFQELSEKTGYIYSFDSHMEEYTNIGNILLSFEIATSKMVSAARIVTDIFCQLKRGEGISLDYVTPPYVDNADMQLDDAESLNWTLAYERHFLHETWRDLSERSECYRLVTPERIQAVAQDIFRPENLTFCYKGKKNEVPEDLLDTVVSALTT